MIDSCNDCKVKCCSVGPGPYDIVSPEIFLYHFGEHDVYNKKCSAFVSGKCIRWGTDLLPYECRVYVCSSRSFTKDELKAIANKTDLK